MERQIESFQENERKSAPDVATLVSKMKDHPSTSGWDAVCSYDGTSLNNILADQFKDLHQIATVAMGSQEQPYRTSYTTFKVPHVTKGITMTQVSYTFGLDLPRLQFSDADERAVLPMPIKSANQSGLSYTLTYAKEADQKAGGDLKEDTWYIRNSSSQRFYEKTQKEVLLDCWDESKEQPKDPFPSNYYFRAANADLIPEFNGKVYVLTSIDLAFPPEEGGDKASDPFEGKSYILQARVPLAAVAGNQVHPSGTVVTFDASKGRTQGQIILNFDITSGTGAEFALLDASGSNQVPTILKDAPTLLEDLKVYFSKALSGIELRLAGVSAGQATPGHIPIKPRSFVFWSTQIGDSPVLSIYLNIDGSTTPDPTGRPSFQYNNGEAGLPVPKGYTGSLILSRDYLTRYYFLQAFSRSGFNNLNPTGDTSSPISFGGSIHKPTTVQGDTVDVALSFLGFISGFTGADYGTVNINDYQFGFTFGSDDTLSINSAQVATVNIPVYIHSESPADPPFPPHHFTDQKTATATISINKSISLSSAQPYSDGFALAFSVAQNDYSVSTTSDIGANCDDHTQRDVEAKVREKIGDIAPSITVSLPELQTFAIENMLFNGATKFNLDPKSKMHFPHDLLLLGFLS